MALISAPVNSPLFAEVNMGVDSSAPMVRATVVQASTIFYDTPATLDKAERLLAEAASYGSQLVVFPEAFVGGYPRGSNFGVTIGSRTAKGKEEFRKYHAAAIDVPGPEVDRLAAMAGKYKVYLVMGVIERDGYTLYCTVLFFDSQGRYLGKHRKLMPTALERIIWGFGDGTTIPVFETPIGKIGAVICWENRMPLLRAAMYGKGIEIYCAPTADARDVWQASMTHIALEGGCFVLSANQFCRRKDYPPPPEYVFTDKEEDLTPDSVVCAGGSVIISPSGTVLAGPNYEGEALISADLDLGEISAMDDLQTLKTRLCIIGSGPAAHTAAIYAARAELKPILFEGWMANDIAPGGQLTTTSDVENFPGFPDGILGMDITERFRSQSLRFGTQIFTETVNKVDFSSTPFKIFTDSKTVVADTVIVATGAVAKRLSFPGSGDGKGGFWNRGISACAVCDGAAPIFRNKPLAVIGGGDSAMEEATFLTKYGSKVYILHRRDEFRASKIMQSRALSNPKIEVLWNSTVVEAYGEGEKGTLGGLKVENVVTGEVSDLKVSGLFFAIGHEPATKFLDGQLKLHSDGYVVTDPGTTQTSVKGVFAAGDVQDKKYRQAVTAAGTGCMAALEAEHYLQEIGAQEGKSD